MSDSSAWTGRSYRESSAKCATSAGAVARISALELALVCDDSNNPGSVVDANKFVADIFIKPARSINFISLNFIATRTGVDFTEVAG